MNALARPSINRFTPALMRCHRAAMLVVCLGLPASGLPDGSGDPASTIEFLYSDQHCARTTMAAYSACYHEGEDDFWIGWADCYNLAEEADRTECFNENRSARLAATEECLEQAEARDAVCELTGQQRYDPEYEPADFVDPAQIGASVEPNPFLLGEAEDVAQVVALEAQPELGEDNIGDCADGCLQTLEWSPLEPGASEFKYYQPGLGLVEEVDRESGETVELVEFSSASP